MSREDVARTFRSDRMRDLIFSDEVLKEGRNTEAVEVSPNSLMVARVKDYKPAAPRTFEEVKAGIEEFLRIEAATKLAVAKGEEALAALREGKEVKDLEWIPPVVIDRQNAQGLTDLVMRNAFKIKADSLPAYAGVEDPNKGYVLIQVTAVNERLPEDDDEIQSAKLEMQNALATEYVEAYLKTLRAKGKVTINQDLIQTSSDY